MAGRKVGMMVVAALGLAACGEPSGTASHPLPTDAPSSTPTIASPATGPNGDLGATVAQFKAAHGAESGPGAVCTAVNACFGPRIVNSEGGATYEFVNTFVTAGLVTGYGMNFPDGTTIAAAKAEVFKWLPADTTTTLYQVVHVNGSCVMWNVSSRTLGQEFSPSAIGDPQGVLGIIFSYVNPQLQTVYDPNNVQHADVNFLTNDPAAGC